MTMQPLLKLCPWQPSHTADLSLASVAAEVRVFHQTIPGYQPTPLCRLRALAEQLGVAEIFVKDESQRFDLKAFKVLGGSYAIAKSIAKKLGEPLAALPFERLVSPGLKARLGEQTFITATDGNHGRGVAWTAQKLGQRAVVYMPQGTVPERLENIRALGAEASILDLNYDDCVRLAAKTAAEQGWTLVQDTAWEGYSEIPTWIMQGYLTLGEEIREELARLASPGPTHIFLQAGVGAMAGALTAYVRSVYGPAVKIAIVEPLAADCFFRTAEANDGQLHKVEGEMRTIMAGLACGEVCPLVWPLTAGEASAFIAQSDAVAATAMRVLAHPVGDDPAIESGESGASAFGAFYALMTEPSLAAERQALDLNEKARVLLISTEGATDRANYRKIVEG